MCSRTTTSAGLLNEWHWWKPEVLSLGVGDLYTDPQIHTAEGLDYGDGNMGPRGMALFFTSHKCNKWVRRELWAMHVRYVCTWLTKPMRHLCTWRTKPMRHLCTWLTKPVRHTCTWRTKSMMHVTYQTRETRMHVTYQTRGPGPTFLHI